MEKLDDLLPNLIVLCVYIPWYLMECNKLQRKNIPMSFVNFNSLDKFGFLGNIK